MTFNTEKCCSDVLLFSTAKIAKKNLHGFGVHVSWMNIIMPSKKTKTLLAPSFIWFKKDFWISVKNSAIPFFVALFLSKQQEKFGRASPLEDSFEEESKPTINN